MMPGARRMLRGLGRRASVSVEFALVSIFILLPLFAGSADMLEVISAQAQVNTALQSLYYTALTNASMSATAAPANAALVLSLINTTALHKVSLGTPNGTLSYACSDGSTPTGTGAASTCGTGQLQIFASYQVTSSVNLTLPLSIFGFPNPFPLSATGTIQIQ